MYDECVRRDKAGLIRSYDARAKNQLTTKLTTENGNSFFDDRPFLLDCPCWIRQRAVHEFFTAKNSALKRLQLDKPSATFRDIVMKPKHRWGPANLKRNEVLPLRGYSLNLERDAATGRFTRKDITINVGTSRARRQVDLRVHRRVPKELRDLDEEAANAARTQQVKLMKTWRGVWYLLIPLAIKQELTDSTAACALDPGVKTFQTVYGTDGTLAAIGNDQSRIQRFHRLADKAADFQKARLHKCRRNCRQRTVLRYHERVRNLVRHIHNTTASALCRSFGLILIPKFSTTEMARRVRPDGNPRRLNAATCRLMYALAHYAFRIRLMKMAQRFRNVKVRFLSEAYTSMTCGLCGHRNYNLGGNRVYRCRNPTCAYRAGRDDNAARLILVKQQSLIVGP